MNTEAEIFDIIWGWVDLVLNTIKEKDILIIFSDQNAPSGVEEYIVIQKPFDSQDPVGSGNVTKTDSTGKVTITQNWEATLNISEERSANEYLPLLSNTLNFYQVKEYFRDKDLSILNILSNNNITRQEGSQRIKGASMDVRVAYTITETDTPGYINTVDFDGTYTNKD